MPSLKPEVLRSIAAGLKHFQKEDIKSLTKLPEWAIGSRYWEREKLLRYKGLREGLFNELRIVPEKEYERISDISLIPQREGVSGRYNLEANTLEFDPFQMQPGTGYHEFAHARQFTPLLAKPGENVKESAREVATMGAFINLSQDLPYEARLIERHANAFANTMEKARPEDYDEVFRATARVLTREIEGSKKLNKWLDKVGLTYKDLLIGALAATGISVASLGIPDEAEAVSGSSFMKAVKRLPWKTAERRLEKVMSETESRKKMLPEALEALRNLYEDSRVEKVYLGGSTVSTKENPSDVDLFIKFNPYKKRENVPIDKLEKPSDIIHETHIMPYGSQRGSSSGVRDAEELIQGGKKKYGKEHDWVRLLGIGAATAGGMMLANPDDQAYAMNFRWLRNIFRRKGAGKFIKPGIERMETVAESSADKALRGKILEGRVITKVDKSEGDWRTIRFADGSTQVVKKEDIWHLAKEHGTNRYTDMFEKKENPDKYNQAMKSLQMREKRAVPKEGISDIKKTFKRHSKRIGEFGEEVHGQVLCERNGKYFSMPAEYAQYLENLDIVTIVEKLK